MERKARREQVDAEQAAKRARKEAAAATAAADAPTVKAEPMLDAPAPASAPAAAEGGKVELHRVPAHSAWFRWDSAHEVERASLPEFFNGKSTLKTPQMYREYRNFIIDRSREAAAQGRVQGRVGGLVGCWLSCCLGVSYRTHRPKVDPEIERHAPQN